MKFRNGLVLIALFCALPGCNTPQTSRTRDTDREQVESEVRPGGLKDPGGAKDVRQESEEQQKEQQDQANEVDQQ